MINVAEEVAHLTSLHDELIHRHGGAEGGPKANCVESAIGTAEQSAGYFEDESGENVLAMPAFALVYLARNQCYTDGNKRVAWAAFTRLLGRYNLSIEVSDEEATTFVLRLAEDRETDPQEHVRRVILWASEKLISIEVPAVSLPAVGADHSVHLSNPLTPPEAHATDSA